MTGRLVAWSARHSRSVIVAALLLALLGDLARRSLARDVIPDLADPQLAILADWMGHPASDVASDVTRVLEASLDGVAGVVAVRGQSMTGMAYLDVVFASAHALTAARPEIVERVEAARKRLPATARVRVGPAVSSTGWVFQYALFDPTHGQPLRELRRLQTQVLVPALAAIPGVAEVATVGGGVQDVLVEVHSDALAARALAFSDVVAAVHAGLASGRATSAARARGAAGHWTPARPARRRARPHRRRRAHPAQRGHASGRRRQRRRAVGLDGRHRARAAGREAAAADRGGARRARARARAAAPRRAPGRSPTIGWIWSIASATRCCARWPRRSRSSCWSILIFLLHARSALVPLATLPLVLLLTFAGMWLLGVPATIMSLGGIGIALGMAVDADVVALEACHRRLEALGAGRARRRAARGADARPRARSRRRS